MPEKSELAVAIHELIEFFKCREDGITDAQVTEFDARFLAEQQAGLRSRFDESGNDPRAPYRLQHEAATAVERTVVKVLGLSWAEHERAVEAAVSALQK